MAKDAGALAGEAGARAEAPGSRAAGAFSLAEQGMSRASVNERSLGRMYENLDNCQMLKGENVVFGFYKAELTVDAKTKRIRRKFIEGIMTFMVNLRCIYIF